MGKPFGLTALIFGLISIPNGIILVFTSLFGWGYLICWIIAPVAIIFGILGIKKDDSKKKAVEGLVLGIVGLIIAIYLFLGYEIFDIFSRYGLEAN